MRSPFLCGKRPYKMRKASLKFYILYKNVARIMENGVQYYWL